MIQANCRERFTADDFDFVVRILSTSERHGVSLVSLLTDAEARDAILDHPSLMQAILAQDASLAISPQFYFYVLLRHVLKDTDLGDRTISDYLASLLETFSQTARLRSPADGNSNPVQYVSDMLIALRNASAAQSFLIRAHVGNYSLFITGMFPETVQSRALRGAPDVSFYEDVGRSNFKAVARHELARSCALTRVFDSLSEQFHEVRLALNRLADSLVHLDGVHPPGLSLLS